MLWRNRRSAAAMERLHRQAPGLSTSSCLQDDGNPRSSHSYHCKHSRNPTECRQPSAKTREFRVGLFQRTAKYLYKERKIISRIYWNKLVRNKRIAMKLVMNGGKPLEISRCF